MPRRTRLLIAAAAMIFTLVPAGAASAATLAGTLGKVTGTVNETLSAVGVKGLTLPVWETDETFASCSTPGTAALLARFGDDRNYFVAPGGSFELGSASGWQLDGAAVRAGSSGLRVLGVGLASLSIAPGGSALSPAFCVDERFPTFRLSTAGSGELGVQVVYPEKADNVRDAGTVPARSTWSLSGDVGLEPTYGVQVNGWRKVALRFVNTGRGTIKVDDIVIDPRMR